MEEKFLCTDFDRLLASLTPTEVASLDSSLILEEVMKHVAMVEADSSNATASTDVGNRGTSKRWSTLSGHDPIHLDQQASSKNQSRSLRPVLTLSERQWLRHLIFLGKLQCPYEAPLNFCAQV